MAYAIDNQSGVDLTNIQLAADVLAAGGQPKQAIGDSVMGNDGKFYVFAKANAAITASTAVCTVSPTTFLATASGGSYTSPATTMASGDYGWFNKAQV